MVAGELQYVTSRARGFLLALVAALAFVTLGPAPTAQAHADYNLMLSPTADRSGAVPLEGRALKGSAFIFASPPLEVTRVAFYLDDPNRTGRARLTENLAPFDFAGGSLTAATAWNTTTVADGVHSITAVLTLADQPQLVVTSSFTVGNGSPALAASPPSVPLAAVIGGAPDSRVVQVAATNGTAATLAASESAPWLTAGLAGGTTPTSLTLTASPAGLAAGTYTATVSLTASGYSSTTVAVTFTVGAAAPTWQLLVSSSSNRATPAALQSYSARGLVYIFVGPQAGPAKVEFWLDNPARTGTPRRTESSAPWDFVGGTSTAASPLDVGTLSGGSHLVSARLTWADGRTQILEATFSTGAVAPNPPTGVSATGSQGQVRLTWTSAAGTGVAGYHVFRSTSSPVSVAGAPLTSPAPVAGTEYVDSSVINGTAYYYVVVTVLTDGSRSPAGSEVSATPGTAPPFQAKINFSDQATAAPPGYLKDFGEAYGPRTGADQGSGLTYGWVRPGSSVPVSLVGLGRNRVVAGVDIRLRTLIHMESTTPGSWEMGVPVGAYTVTVWLGDPSFYTAEYTLDIEDQNAVAAVIPSPTQPGVSAQRTVWVADGRLTLDAVRGTNAKIQYVEISGVPNAEQRPRVLRTNPVNAAIGVAPEAGIAAELDLAGPGIDIATLDSSTAQLVELATGTPVGTAVTADASGIGVVPVQTLVAGRWYRFTVTAGLKDTDGAQFLPWSSVFAAGAASNPASPPLATPSELVFSGVAGTVSESRSITVTNPGTTALSVTGLSFAGADGSAFQLAADAPSAPLTIAAGASISVPVQFAPSSSTVGSLSASLSVTTATGVQPALSARLYGLSANGLEGSNEPPLAAVVDTLGHRIDVGGTALELGTSAAPLGNEVAAQLFARAGSGPVTITPVARYSTDGTVGFGWYLPGATPTRTTVGTIATGQFQTLLPGLTGGSSPSFDPGAATFGLFSLPSSVNRSIYSQDSLNTGVAHAVRVYPAKDRAGVPLPNTYLVGFEEASNGDYQDYLYRVTNVVPAATPAPNGGAFTWTTQAPNPVARFESDGVVTGGKVYVFGGFINSSLNVTTRADAYDIATNTWTRIAEMPEGTTHTGVAFDGRYVWLVGGYVGQHPGGATASVWKYDTTSDVWVRGPSLPAIRGAGGATVVAGRVHFVGGTSRAAGATTDPDEAEHWSVPVDGGSWTVEPSLPLPRNHMGVTALDGKIYVIGGQLDRVEATALDRVDVYDVETRTWSQKRALPVARGHINSATFALNGRIVVVGGSVSGPAPSPLVSSYDPSTDTWIALPSLPAGRKSPVAGAFGGRLFSTTGNASGSTPSAEMWSAPITAAWATGTTSPVALGEVSAGVIGSTVYVVGEGSTATLAYDLGRRTWRTTGLAVRPFVGNHHSSEVIDGKLWLFGGLGGGAGRVQVYDPVANTWSTRADIPFATGSTSTAVIGRRVYVVGGVVGSSTTTQAAAYDVATNTWSSLAPMPQGRNHAAAATDGTRLWVFGGRGPGSGDNNTLANGFDTVQVYDPGTDTWESSLDPGSTLPALPRARGGMGKAVYANGEFYVMGGETLTGAGATALNVYDRVDIFSSVTNSWRQGSPMPTPRHGISPVLLNGSIHVLLGGTQAGNSSSTRVESYSLG